MGDLANRLGYRGYVTCRPFGGLQIPVPVQSLMMRDYCARNGLVYKLHVNENIFPRSYLVLEGLVRRLDGLEGLLVTSAFMLPKRRERRQAVYDAVFEQGASLHFVMEDIVLAKPGDETAIEEILDVYNALALCPASVPDAPESA